MNNIFKLILSCCLLSCLQLVPSYSQPAGELFKGIGNNNNPIHIEADRVEILNDVYRATFENNVLIIQGETVLNAGKVEVFYLPESQRNLTPSGIREIIVSNKVAIKSGKNHATGDRLEINFINDTAVLSGKEIILSQGLNAVKGCELTIELTTGNSSFGKCRSTMIVKKQK